MIRFVDLGYQLSDEDPIEGEQRKKHFAFFNQVNEQFLSVGGVVTFTSASDFERHCADAPRLEQTTITLLRDLLPPWTKEVDNAELQKS